MKRLFGIMLAIITAAVVAHGASAYLPVTYGTTANTGPMRMFMTADSVKVQQWVGGQWVTRASFVNGGPILFDLPASSDSSISRVGSGTFTTPKRYRVNQEMISQNSDSSLTRTGNGTSASPKKLKVNQAMISMNSDSTLARTGNGTSASPKKLKVNVGSNFAWTGTHTFGSPFINVGLSATWPTVDATHVRMFRSGSTGGSYPFTEAGHLILQSRDTGALRDILFATGNPSQVRYRITGDGGFGDVLLDGSNNAGIVQCLSATIGFGASDDSVALGTLPIGAIITHVIAQVDTAFNAGTTNVVTVGTVIAHESIVNTASLDETSATAQLVRGDNTLTNALAADTPIWAYYTQTGDAASAGQARLSVFFIKP